MLRYNIPASITLAQGLFESAAGQSRLALYSNNHFGIKCHVGQEEVCDMMMMSYKNVLERMIMCVKVMKTTVSFW